MFNMSRVENWCYCFDDRSKAECDGYTDISGCFENIPLALTHPHFLGSNYVGSKILGLSRPTLENDLSYMDIEPVLGVPITVAIKFQINLIIDHFSLVSKLNKIKPCVYPVLKFNLVSLIII